MIAPVLNRAVLLPAVSASTVGAWFPLDWRFQESVDRKIVATKSATEGDLLIECMVVSAIVTVTAMPSASLVMDVTLVGPYEAVRIRTLGATSLRTAWGLV